MIEIKFYVKEVAGVPLRYAASPLEAMRLFDLTGKKTIDDKTMKALSHFGVLLVKVPNPFAEAPAESEPALVAFKG